MTVGRPRLHPRPGDVYRIRAGCRVRVLSIDGEEVHCEYVTEVQAEERGVVFSTQFLINRACCVEFADSKPHRRRELAEA